MTSQSYVQVSPNGGAVSFVGPDAISLFRVKTLKRAVALHKSCGMIMTRGATITKVLAQVSLLTGKAYKGATKHDAALADLTAHIAALECAMPIEVAPQ